MGRPTQSRPDRDTFEMDLRAGHVVVGVDPERGGRLTSARIGGHELLVAARDPGGDSRLWGSYLMAPWVGRLEGASFGGPGSGVGPISGVGGPHRFVADQGPHAMHGLVLDRPWTVVASNARSVTLRIALGDLGWPFRGWAGQRIRVWPDRIRCDAWISADRPAPVALGWHPWFRRGDATTDAVLLDAAEVLETRSDLVATGRRLPLDAVTDLGSSRPLGDRRLDHSYLRPSSPATLRVAPVTLRIEFSRRVCAVHVHTPEGGICVEPMTAWPNAANLAAAGVRGTGLARLPAGGRLAASMRWRWTMDPS